YGGRNWVPVVGDWNGDGIDTIGVVDPTTGTWYLRNENSPGAPDIEPFRYGAPGWTPVVGDWDGDGVTTIGVVNRQGRWYLKTQNSPGAPDIAPFAYGAPGWKPVVGDWDGDGKTTIGVFDPAGKWYLRNSNGPGAPDLGPFPYGSATWVPVAGSWDIPPSPVLAARGENRNNPVTRGVSAQALDDIGMAALERMQDAGADPALLAALDAADVKFADLEPGVLALVDARQNRLLLDTNAAGYGWFVDQTPLQEEEFQAAGGAALGSPATG